MAGTARIVLIFTVIFLVGSGTARSAEQLGLVVVNGQLTKGGKPFRGIGANYFTCFSRSILDANDTSYEANFKRLSEAGIPFVRFMCCGFWPEWQKLYLENPEEYFARLDRLVRCAEEHHLGLIPDLFWWRPTISDVVGENVSALGDQDSKTIAFMRRYTAEVVQRYVHSPAIWGWEFGNEYMLAADLPEMEKWRQEDLYPELGTPARRTEADDLTYPIINHAFLAFAKTVRKYDKHRFITTGNAVPRQSAWHNVTEHTWDPDSRDQFHEILLRDNPDPYDTISIHVYHEPKHGYAGRADSIGQLIGWSKQFADEAKKPLFLGEFGADKQLGPQQERACFEEFIAAIEQHQVPLAAFWVFDNPNMENDWNVRFDNDRSYMLDLVAAANARMRK